MTAGFIGLGAMGAGMALNLKKGGVDVLAAARRAEARRALAARGLSVTAENAEAAARDVLFLCLPDAAASESVLLGAAGVLGGMRPGQIVVDCGTIGYGKARELAAACAERGVAYLDAPVSGHRAKAENGTLTIMCGGAEEVFERVRPLLEKMGTTVLYMGESGCGQLTKTINNCALNICAASFCELMPLGVKLGLPPEKLGNVLMTATGSSYASRTLIPEVLEGRFDHDFTMERAYKDMLNLFELTGQYAVPLPTASGAMQTYQLALQGGQGGAYKGAMIRFFETMLGVECRKEGKKEE